MKSPVAALLAALFALIAGAGFAAAQSRDNTIALRDMGSFHVGGRDVEISGQPTKSTSLVPGGPVTVVDPNGTHNVEKMYAQYFLPAKRRGTVPLLLWHGATLTGATYETTPDGRPGWLNYFIRRGWDTYLSDAVERGRSGFAPPQIFTGDPVFLTKDNPFLRFRIGVTYDNDPAKRRGLPGTQFPIDAYDDFVRQLVPRWLTTDAAVISAYTALVDKVCPCVVVAHSQGGPFAYAVAAARPEKIRALVVVEPAGAGTPATAAALVKVPILSIFGDYIVEGERWATIRNNGRAFYQKIEEAGGRVKQVDLPQIGIHGNSHMIPMDKNNMVVAGEIQKWLAQRPGLYR
jgi:pimeloyl-ACP methyl ester carboxylesterase